jgi:hypothetical protein
VPPLRAPSRASSPSSPSSPQASRRHGNGRAERHAPSLILTPGAAHTAAGTGEGGTSGAGRKGDAWRPERGPHGQTRCRRSGGAPGARPPPFLAELSASVTAPRQTVARSAAHRRSSRPRAWRTAARTGEGGRGGSGAQRRRLATGTRPTRTEAVPAAQGASRVTRHRRGHAGRPPSRSTNAPPTIQTTLTLALIRSASRGRAGGPVAPGGWGQKLAPPHTNAAKELWRIAGIGLDSGSGTRGAVSTLGSRLPRVAPSRAGEAAARCVIPTHSARRSATRRALLTPKSLPQLASASSSGRVTASSSLAITM